MSAEQTNDELESQRRFEELSDRVAANRADIDALLARGATADRRADASEARADASEARADEDSRRISDLEARADVDRELLLELQAEGLLNREQVAHLEEALRTSRTIGAAIGIVMASRRLDEKLAFEVLRKASSLTNRKLRVVAEEVVLTGDTQDLPVL